MFLEDLAFDGVPFAAEPRPGVSGEIGSYLADRAAEGRGLFDMLGDEFVLDHLDEHPRLLDELALDSQVRSLILH
jgi:hypothetical protein